MRIKTAAFAALAATGLALAGCSSMPSMDLTNIFSSKPTTAAVQIESEPAGADARLPTGETCKTPCSLTVPTAGEVSVTLSLEGFQPQTLPVRPRLGESGQMSPVIAQLEPIAPPKGKKKGKPAKVAKVTKPKAAPAADENAEEQQQ
jgi:hypothetical protein